MQQASKIGHGREATFSEINEALMNYSSTQIALLSAHNIARINFIREKEEYDEWFANRYLTIRKEVNPVTLSAQKWFSQKEIEMMVKNKYKEEYKSRIWDLHQTEHKLNFLRRLIDSWEKHSFILHQLGKNLQSEINANLRQTGGSDMSFGDDGGFPA
jgi:asparagine synthetase B (glutamine-hydrolysing)